MRIEIKVPPVKRSKYSFKPVVFKFKTIRKIYRLITRKKYTVKQVVWNWKKFSIPSFNHSFHLVKPSCLPLLTGFSSFLLVSGIVFYWNYSSNAVISFVDSFVLHLGVFMFSNVILAWLLMVLYESGQGYHTSVVRKGLRLGIVLFIVSEVMFFFSLFWAFFHFSLSPAFDLGHMWPPVHFDSAGASQNYFDTWGLPFTNTVLLLSSGVTITFAHHYIKENNNLYNSRRFIIYLAATVILGVTFLVCQWVEYTYGLNFRWTDNVFGSIFFITTGFHGFHVLLGTYGLLFCLLRALITSGSTSLPRKMARNVFDGIIYYGENGFVCYVFRSHIAYEFDRIKNVLVKYLTLFLTGFSNLRLFKFTNTHHIGFEAALWYWHFVDVVWIFLFCTVYWWNCN